MSKFVEDGKFFYEGEPVPLYTPDQVFGELGVYCEPDAVQRAALAEWLCENEPVPLLRLGLERAGLIDADGHAIPPSGG